MNLRHSMAVLSAFALASSLCACKSACKPGEPDAFWSAHPDLLPQGSVICHTSERSSCTSGSDCHTYSIHVDMPEDRNPWVTAVKLLESRGFERTSQDIAKNDIQFATLVGEDGLRLRITAYRREGITDRRPNRLDIDAEIPTKRAQN